PSTVRVRIRNYDPAKLEAFWSSYRQNLTYNLTHRNCSSTVSNAPHPARAPFSRHTAPSSAASSAFVRLL
ncbi:DUF308 domain-containing protein, partial [Burkholderia cenocepacia]|nr:DUF308 domain-containing protein [Burkholderia cenocepacia]